MTTLDDFFSHPTEPLHPRLRDWKHRLAEPGTSAKLEIFHPETAVGQSQTEIYLQFTKEGRGFPWKQCRGMTI